MNSQFVNQDAMIQDLKQLSNATEAGRHAVMITGGADWDIYDTAAEFKNVTLIKLPLYSSELNLIG